MKKNKLIADFNYDFDLLGIIAPVKEHRLAWYMNQLDDIHLIKEEDIIIEFKDLSKMSISNYVCRSEQHSYTLLKNKLVLSASRNSNILLPELQQFDFFLKLESQVDDFNLNDLFEPMKEISVISYLVKLDLNSIKQKENLLY